MGSVCHAEDVAVRFDGAKAKVKTMQKDSVKVAVNGACVSIESLYKTHKLTLRLSGRSDDGQLVLKTAGKAKVTLDGLTLTSQEGAPLWLKNKKKVEVKAVKGTVNTLTVTACTDTANHKGAVIWAKDKLLLSGKGVLNLVATGDGCRGLKTQKDITIEELTLNVTTSGNNLGEKPFGFGGSLGSVTTASAFRAADSPCRTSAAVSLGSGTTALVSQAVGSPDSGMTAPASAANTSTTPLPRALPRRARLQLTAVM